MPGYPLNRVEPADLTVRVLEEIRDDQRGMREDLRGMREDLRASVEAQAELAREFRNRFEVIETTLRDLAQQMVLLARGVKVAIEQRGQVDSRFEAIEQRIAELEKRAAG
jgi:methyl-accepting chemotaxis protein